MIQVIKLFYYLKSYFLILNYFEKRLKNNFKKSF